MRIGNNFKKYIKSFKKAEIHTPTLIEKCSV